jgi:hypothetical protein
MNEAEQYVLGLTDELERIRQRKGIGLFKVHEKLTNNIVIEIERTFGTNPAYSLDIRKCPQCTHEYDIIITIRYTNAQL